MSPTAPERRSRTPTGPNRGPRGRRLAIVAGSLVTVAAILALAGFVSQDANDPGRTAADPAPDVELVDFEGNTLRLSDFAGTPVVLNFWASWCPPCVAEMPDFEAVHQDVGDRVTFIGVNFQDDPDLAAALAVETGVSYLLVRDPQGVIFGEFDGLGMPTTVFIDAAGSVREVITGQMSQGQLRAKIAEHFSVDA